MRRLVVHFDFVAWIACDLSVIRPFFHYCKSPVIWLNLFPKRLQFYTLSVALIAYLIYGNSLMSPRTELMAWLILDLDVKWYGSIGMDGNQGGVGSMIQIWYKHIIIIKLFWLLRGCISFSGRCLSLPPSRSLAYVLVHCNFFSVLWKLISLFWELGPFIYNCINPSLI